MSSVHEAIHGENYPASLGTKWAALKMELWASPQTPSPETQLRKPGGIDSSAYWFWIWRITPRGLVSVSQRHNVMRQMGPGGKTSQGRAAKCPFLTLSGMIRDGLVLIFTGIPSHQAAFEEDDGPKESCSLEKKKIKLLKYKLSNCHELACASGKKVGAKHLAARLTLQPPFGLWHKY